MQPDQPLIFLLMARRPPRSTLFPYTRSSDLHVRERVDHRAGIDACVADHAVGRDAHAVAQLDAALEDTVDRSEEHTPELQSRRELVCRLLLEKKKKLFNTPNLKVNDWAELPQ